MDILRASTTVTPSPDGFTMPPLLWGPGELTEAAGPPAGWLWHGLLAPGAVTLMSSLWKAGKTTLVSVLLARMKGGGQLAGLPLAAGQAIVITEESPTLWRQRHDVLDFGDNVGWFCRPFLGRPRLKDWSAFVDGLAELHGQRPFSLAIIDPLAAFMPGNENDAGAMMDAMLPLQRLTARNVSVLVLHHPPKNEPSIGRAARGSGALSGYADILLEMRTFGDPDNTDRRRKLWTFSRFPESPANLVIEWSADGKDYLALGNFQEEEFTRRWQRLRNVLAGAQRKLSRQEILGHWKGGTTPELKTLKRWLDKAVRKGLVRQDGAGLREQPFRYWLPEKEDEWRKDEWALLLMPELMQTEGEKKAGPVVPSDESGRGNDNRSG
jgi:hypothetical protein